VSISLLSNQKMLSEPCDWGRKIHEFGSFVGVCFVCSIHCPHLDWVSEGWLLGQTCVIIMLLCKSWLGAIVLFVCLYSYHCFVQQQFQIVSLEMFFGKHIWSNTKIALDWNNSFCICHLSEIRYGLTIKFLIKT